MGWSDEVHQSRVDAELQRARREYRLRKRAYDVPVTPDSTIVSFLGVLGAVGSLVWWNKEGHKLRGRNWKHLPGVRQLYTLLTNKQLETGSSSVSGRPRPRPPGPRPAGRSAPASGPGRPPTPGTVQRQVST